MQDSTAPKIATAAELRHLEREAPLPVPELNMDGAIGADVNSEVAARKEARMNYLRGTLETGRERTRSDFQERSCER